MKKIPLYCVAEAVAEVAGPATAERVAVEAGGGGAAAEGRAWRCGRRSVAGAWKARRMARRRGLGGARSTAAEGDVCAWRAAAPSTAWRGAV